MDDVREGDVMWYWGGKWYHTISRPGEEDKVVEVQVNVVKDDYDPAISERIIAEFKRARHKELMTQVEKKIVGDLGDLMGDIRSIMGTDVPADVREATNHIHALQNMVLSQAARRKYPNDFRMLGSRGAWRDMDGDVNE